MEQVLDFTPQITRNYLTDESALVKADDSIREDEIRRNLKNYEGKRLLTMKFQKQLEEHLSKTGNESRQIKERIKKLIVERING